MAKKAVIIAGLGCFAALLAVPLSFYAPLLLSTTEPQFRQRGIGPPRQPVVVTQECGETKTVELSPVVLEIGQIGDRFGFVDALPCYTGNEYLYAVAAEPAELHNVVRRPEISLRIDDNAHVQDLKLIRSSGSTALDERALRAVLAHSHNKNYCTRCGVTTVVNVEWNGPIWFRE